MRTRSELKERVQSRNKNFTNLEGNAADCVDCTYLILASLLGGYPHSGAKARDIVP